MDARATEAGIGAARGDVAALIVSYQPRADLLGHIGTIAPQVERLIVVDNGSHGPVVDEVRALVAQVHGTFIANERNLGMATALNQGARAAASGGARWLLMLDQDTNPALDLAAQLRAAADAFPQPGRVALVGATTEHQTSDRCADGAPYVVRRAVITSGSMLSLAAYRRVGPFRDDFFIDMVEAEYALRAARHGYVTLLACDARMEHAIGSPTRHRLLGRDVTTSNHPAWRRYYMARNRIPVWRANARRTPAWVAFDYMGHLRDTLLMTLYEDGRPAKLAATIAGTIDGLRGVSGATKGPDSS